MDMCTRDELQSKIDGRTHIPGYHTFEEPHIPLAATGTVHTGAAQCNYKYANYVSCNQISILILQQYISGIPLHVTYVSLHR